MPILRHSSIAGKDIILPYHSSFNFCDFLIDAFDESGGYDCIVELGCGYGRNLFEIFYSGGATDIWYYGGEFTKSGVDIATKLANATPNMNATFFHFNHLEPNLDFIKQKGYKRAFVFTSHSIEQVKYIPQNWFKVVSGIAEYVRCIHLEPYGFQSKILGDVTQKHKEFIINQGWNLNFLQELLDAVERQEIVLDDTILEIGCASDAYNPGSIACWYSKNPSF